MEFLWPLPQKIVYLSMVQTKKLTRMTVAVGVMTAISLVLSFLALTDINHNSEPDLSQEWAIVRLTFFLIVLFMGLALATIWTYAQRKS